MTNDDQNTGSKSPTGKSTKGTPSGYDSLSLVSMQFALGLIKSGKLKLQTPDQERQPKQYDPDASE